MGLGTILIRADASSEIGTGHVMRCLALAQEWRDQGGRAVFAMAESIPAIRERVTSEFEAVSVPGSVGSREDGDFTSALAREYAARWVMLDGYRFGPGYHEGVKASGCKMLVVDDIGDCSARVADIVLNQNVHAHERMYPNRPSHSQLLLGPRFVLLRREFSCTEELKFEVRETGTRVLIMMGGSDPQNLSGRILRAIESSVAERLQVVVVAGPGSPQGEAHRGSSRARRHEVRLVHDPKFLPGLMLWADVAVSAAGSTIWELCRVGIPSILMTFAENQVPGARELSRQRIAVYVGAHEEVVDADIARELRDLLGSKERRSRISQLGRELIDGAGCKRVLAAMQNNDLRLRRATQDDCMLLFRWVNDPAVREASFQSATVSEDEHAVWFAGKLKSDHALIYIGENDEGSPVGQFRVEWNGRGKAQVDVSLAQEKRGLRIAATLIRRGVEKACLETGLRSFHAYIKPENAASLKAFEKAGFSKVQEFKDSVHCCKEVGRE